MDDNLRRKCVCVCVCVCVFLCVPVFVQICSSDQNHHQAFNCSQLKKKGGEKKGEGKKKGRSIASGAPPKHQVQPELKRAQLNAQPKRTYPVHEGKGKLHEGEHR